MTKLEKFIIRSWLVNKILLKSKKLILPGFGNVPLYNVIRFFYRQMKTVGINERTSAISYHAIMALPPALLFLFTLLPHLPFINKKSIKGQLHQFISDVIPLKQHNQNIIEFIDTFFGQPKFALLSTGFILSFYFASNAMMAIMRSFNKNYVGFQERKGWQNRIISLRLTVLLFALVLGTLVLLIAQSSILKSFNISNKQLITIITSLKWPTMLALIFYSIAFIYKLAPAVHEKWSLYSPGAIVATLLTIVATLLFSIFVNSFGKYNFLYGTIGTVIVMMSLIYINTLMLLIGFELNVSISTTKLSMKTN